MGISWGPKKLIWVYLGGDGRGFFSLVSDLSSGKPDPTQANPTGEDIAHKTQR